MFCKKGKETMNYKIGEILKFNEDTKVEIAGSDKKAIVPKGSKVIIGADGLAHHLRDGSIQPLDNNATVEGYDRYGMALYLYHYLVGYIQLDTLLEESEGINHTKDDFLDGIDAALLEIGF